MRLIALSAGIFWATLGLLIAIPIFLFFFRRGKKSIKKGNVGLAIMMFITMAILGPIAISLPTSLHRSDDPIMAVFGFLFILVVVFGILWGLYFGIRGIVRLAKRKVVKREDSEVINQATSHFPPETQ